MKRTPAVFLVALALALIAGCTTTPAEEKDPLTLQAEIYKARLEHEKEMVKVRAEADEKFAVAMTKIALSTDSDFAKGMAAGAVGFRMAGGSAPAPAATNNAPPMFAIPQKRDWLDRTLQVGDFTLRALSLRYGYGLQKMQMTNDYNKYALTLGAIDQMANRGFNAASQGMEYLAEKPFFFSLPAGSQPVGTAP